MGSSPLRKSPAPTTKATLSAPTVVLLEFDKKQFDDARMAIAVGSFATYASQHYRDSFAGKSGAAHDLERLHRRRILATEIFQAFEMLPRAVRTAEELVEVRDAQAEAAKAAKKKPVDEIHSTLDELNDIGMGFVREYYDPAEAEVPTRNRTELIDLIDKYSDHPVIRASSAWIRIDGNSHEMVRADGVLLQRASALILERISGS